MDSAIPIKRADAVLLAGVHTTLTIARTHNEDLRPYQHPLHQRAYRIHGEWVPLLLDELDTCTNAVEALHGHDTDTPLSSYAADAVHRIWMVAAAELPVIGEGIDLRWAPKVDPGIAVERAYRRMRGEENVPNPRAQTKTPRVFTRPSKRSG